MAAAARLVRLIGLGSIAVVSGAVGCGPPAAAADGPPAPVSARVWAAGPVIGYRPSVFGLALTWPDPLPEDARVQACASAAARDCTWLSTLAGQVGDGGLGLVRAGSVSAQFLWQVPGRAYYTPRFVRVVSADGSRASAAVAVRLDAPVCFPTATPDAFRHRPMTGCTWEVRVGARRLSRVRVALRGRVQFVDRNTGWATRRPTPLLVQQRTPRGWRALDATPGLSLRGGRVLLVARTDRDDPVRLVQPRDPRRPGARPAVLLSGPLSVRSS